MGDIETLHNGEHLAFVRRGTWEYVTRPQVSGIVLIIPITADGKIILIEQFRPPVNAPVIELVAGLAGDIAGQADEDILAAARRELLEETGFEAGHFEQVAEGPPSAGASDEYMTVFRATELRKVDAGGGDEHEDIIVHEVPLTDVEPWLAAQQRRGCVIDLKVYAGLYFAN